MPAAFCIMSRAYAQSETPLAGHYPPGQSGFRAAAYPQEGWSYTNFSRFFSNLAVRDAEGTPAGRPDELRYANISMITWTSGHELLGMRYGLLAGIPFSTGNLNPSDGELGNTGLGLGDVLMTPVSLTGTSRLLDYQFQFTVWSDSGRFVPGSADNRGSGFCSLVYSLGAVWYPGASRTDWSVSAIARIEQNFKQIATGKTPGNDIVVDWGIGKIVRGGPRPIEIGVSGFASWQITEQSGGPAPNPGRYRFYGLGPEMSVGLSERWTLRARAHWEFGVRNSVQGNSLWLIVGGLL
jgi:hypothetical protein